MPKRINLPLLNHQVNHSQWEALSVEQHCLVLPLLHPWPQCPIQQCPKWIWWISVKPRWNTLINATTLIFRWSHRPNRHTRPASNKPKRPNNISKLLIVDWLILTYQAPSSLSRTSGQNSHVTSHQATVVPSYPTSSHISARKQNSYWHAQSFRMIVRQTSN